MFQEREKYAHDQALLQTSLTTVATELWECGGHIN